MEIKELVGLVELLGLTVGFVGLAMLLASLDGLAGLAVAHAVRLLGLSLGLVVFCMIVGVTVAPVFPWPTEIPEESVDCPFPKLVNNNKSSNKMDFFYATSK